jgi:hypothetical protein
MESIIKQGRKICPFLKNTSVSTLRMMSVSAVDKQNGSSVSGLQQAAQKCPVMSKHIRVSVQGRSGAEARRNYVMPCNVARLHSSSQRSAEMATLEQVHRTAGDTDLSKGKEQIFRYLVCLRAWCMSSCRGSA